MLQLLTHYFSNMPIARFISLLAAVTILCLTIGVIVVVFFSKSKVERLRSGGRSIGTGSPD